MAKASPSDLSKINALTAEHHAIKQELEHRQYPAWYLATHHHRNNHNRPLTFDRAKFMIPIYKADPKLLVMKASRQCGKTEFKFCRTMSKLEQGWNALDIWPGQNTRTLFSMRLNRQVSFVPHYCNGMESAPLKSDSAVLKYFWNGQIKLIGSNTAAEAKEYPADIVNIEEYDLCNIENVEEALHSLDNSQHGYITWIGNPTVEGEGICEVYRKSDQREWHILCPHCGQWQRLDWFVNVVREVGNRRYELLDDSWDEKSERDIEIYCFNCHKPLDRFSDGEWVPEYPGRDIMGVHISQLFSANVTIAKMWEHFTEGLRDNTKEQKFWNNRLGLGYEGAGAKVTTSKLNSCVRDYPMAVFGRDTTAGIDTGARCCHITIWDYPTPETSRLLWAGTAGLNLDEVEETLVRAGVTCCCIDAHPETHFAKQLRDRLPGIIYMVNYSSTASPHDLKLNEDEYLISVDRTSSIDAMVADIEATAAGEAETFLLPENAPSIDGGNFYRQLCAPTRKFDRERKPRGAWIWDEGSKPDHYFHSCTYNNIASTLRPGPMIIKVGGHRDIGSGKLKGFE